MHNHLIEPIRDASRRLVRELGFMQSTLAGTDLSASSVHALLEIGAKGSLTASELSNILVLEKSSVSRMAQKLLDCGLLAEKPSHRDARFKSLVLTEAGKTALANIERYANDLVQSALRQTSADRASGILNGLSDYATALQSVRTGKSAIAIKSGYQPGALGAIVKMHGDYYSKHYHFGCFFEGKVAAGLAEFGARLDRPMNGLWTASYGDILVGSLAIDGESLGPDIAQLRWFIVDESMHKRGIGRKLLTEAIAFSEKLKFKQIELSTFKGLDQARQLYESHGFVLTGEQSGSQWGVEVIEQKFSRNSPKNPEIPASQ